MFVNQVKSPARGRRFVLCLYFIFKNSSLVFCRPLRVLGRPPSPARRQISGLDRRGIRPLPPPSNATTNEFNLKKTKPLGEKYELHKRVKSNDFRELPSPVRFLYYYYSVFARNKKGSFGGFHELRKYLDASGFKNGFVVFVVSRRSFRARNRRRRTGDGDTRITATNAVPCNSR